MLLQAIINDRFLLYGLKYLDREIMIVSRILYQYHQDDNATSHHHVIEDIYPVKDLQFFSH